MFLFKNGPGKVRFLKNSQLFKCIQQGQPSRKVWRYDGDDDDDDDATILIKLGDLHIFIKEIANFS